MSKILDVPLYENTELWHCGEVALKMVLGYYGTPFEIDWKEKSRLWSIAFANIAAELGHEVKFISTDEKIIGHKVRYRGEAADFYKRVESKAHAKMEDFYGYLELAVKNGVEIEHRKPSIEDLKKAIQEDIPPIVLVNSRYYRKVEGFCGHFLVVCSVGEENVLINNPGGTNTRPQKLQKMDMETFKTAWEYPGTDMDTILIRKKK